MHRYVQIRHLSIKYKIGEELMDLSFSMSKDKQKYLKLLAEKYPSKEAVSREIINLNAILNLPKGTEHFISDLHGEYEAFCHILNNCSGVIKEKVHMLFDGTLSPWEENDLCTLVYYPKEKLELMKKEGPLDPEWYRITLKNLIKLAGCVSSKYTRSKVRKAMPGEFSYIIDELIHVQKDEDDNQVVYHEKILDTIIDTDSADSFITAIASLIKRLAVDHMHVVGDIFDRGDHADKIMNLLLKFHSLDIQWGNHDVLWMGAAAGSDACIANVVRNNIRYKNMTILESGYGISLRKLLIFANETYPGMELTAAVVQAITVILLKLEGQAIMRNPDFHMEDRLLLNFIDKEKGTVNIGGTVYELKTRDFPTITPGHAYELTEGEKEVVKALHNSFVNSERLRRDIDFIYKKGSMYKCYNGNLLFHGCIPLDEEGNFALIELNGKIYKGKAYFDYAESIARRAFYGEPQQSNLDFMWYLWGGKQSPVCGRNIKTFERAFIADKKAWVEEKDPYYTYYKSEKTAEMILREFGLYSPQSHIINGHTPIKAIEGEEPVRADGKVIVIDGGFCKAYHKTTGIAGYTLIYNSHGMRLKAHRPFESIAKAISENKDIESESDTFELEPHRVMVSDTDNGKRIIENIKDLKLLLTLYNGG